MTRLLPADCSLLYPPRRTPWPGRPHKRIVKRTEHRCSICTIPTEREQCETCVERGARRVECCGFVYAGEACGCEAREGEAA